LSRIGACVGGPSSPRHFASAQEAFLRWFVLVKIQLDWQILGMRTSAMFPNYAAKSSASSQPSFRKLIPPCRHDFGAVWMEEPGCGTTRFRVLGQASYREFEFRLEF
jgi:hypothetical protein